MKQVQLQLTTSYITLGQMLKLSDCIDSGGYAKPFLATHVILVNGDPEQRRGRKLYRGDRIRITGYGDFEIV